MDNVTNESNQRHKKEFLEWIKKDKIEVNDELPGSNLKKGQKVTFTNDFGVVFSPFEILGFAPAPRYGRAVYLSWDSWWFAARPENLTVIPN